MSTEGTPDPAPEPAGPVGGDAAGVPEPAPPAPQPFEPAPEASVPSPDAAGQPDAASSYPPPGYAQAPYGQPYAEPGTAGGYEQVPPQPGYQQAAPAYGYQQPYAGQAAPLSPSDERLWATLAHIGGIVFGFIAPLVIWLVFRGRSRFVDDQGKEALNFQILLVIAAIGFSIITAVTLGIGGLLFLSFIVALVFMIQGAIAANRGDLYRYPLNWRIIK